MLTGKRILIVEDEWLLADHLAAIVERAGGTIQGPTASVDATLDLLDRADRPPDAATLNVRLGDDLSYDVADRLAAMGVPYVFISANALQGMPERFHDRPMIAKPFTDPQVAAALTGLVAPDTPRRD